MIRIVTRNKIGKNEGIAEGNEKKTESEKIVNEKMEMKEKNRAKQKD